MAKVEFLDIDRAFGQFVLRLEGKEDPMLSWVSMMLSLRSRSGDSCLDLQGIIDDYQDSFPGGTSLAEMRTELLDCRMVGIPGERNLFILTEDNRIYLYRYWKYESKISEFVRLSSGELEVPVPEGRIKAIFHTKDSHSPHSRAAVNAFRKKFSIISGGPGTGKTWTVARILVLLLESDINLRIVLAAPTGKAAYRLKGSVEEALHGIETRQEVIQAVPREACTVHRLLGQRPSTAECRFNRANPLPYDVVILDEASMIDLNLMNKLIDALPGPCRLIMLGDSSQLASVEAGSVLGDICASSAESVVELEKGMRFSSESSIGKLSLAIKLGESLQAMDIIKNGGQQDVLFNDSDPGDLIEEYACSGFSQYLAEEDFLRKFQKFERFKILSALRQGKYGSSDMNRLVENALSSRGLLRQSGDWYENMPIMITRNSYALGLFNGDVGLVLKDKEREGELRAFFTKYEEDGMRLESYGRQSLPSYEKAFAITVHKSQGSEFDSVLLILPKTVGHPQENFSRIITRELIYTAVTRAKKRVIISSSPEAFSAAIERKTERSSGLSSLLGASGSDPGLFG